MNIREVFGRVGRITAFKTKNSWLVPDLGSFSCPPCVHVGFLSALWFSPENSRWIDYTKLSLGVSESVCV